MKKLVRVLSLILIVLLLAMAIAGISIYRYSLISTTQSGDAAIVLGAAVWQGRPSPVFEERIKHAINLYHENRVDYLIFTGGIGHDDAISEAEIGRQAAIAAGVDPDRILIDDESRITYENIRNAQAQASQYGVNSYLLVSDPFHMKRAVEISEDLGMIAYPSPTPTSRYETWRTKLPFLIRESHFLVSYKLRSFLGLVGG